MRKKAMTTPQKEDVIAKAFEIHAKRNHRISSITPEVEEMKESGIYEEARNSLMRREDFEYVSHVEREARRLNLIDQKEYVDTTKYVKKQLCFDLEEAKRTNVLISGANATGKSRLAMLLAHTLRRNGFDVLVFDNSGVWKELSDIPHYCLVPNRNKVKIRLSRNCILDMSLLRPSAQRRLVDEILEYLWIASVNLPEKTWQFVVLEELQLYARFLRGKLSENIYRIMSTGRNQKLRVIGICPDLALVDSLFIRLCSQRYHFRLSIEENSLRKFRRYYGSDMARVVQHLDTGFCLYYLKGKLQVANIPLWRKPMVVEA